MSKSKRNKLKVLTSILLLTGAGIFTVSHITGCATDTQTKAYQGYAAVGVTVPGVLGEWNAYLGVANPKPSVATEQKMANLYKAWQAGMAVVADTGAVWSAAVNDPSPNPTKITAALAAFNQATLNATSEQNDVIAFYTSVTGKQPTSK